MASYAKTAIIICVVATICGGLGLLRFYEEGDAAALVVPKHSQFRKNIDWIDENFPREVRRAEISVITGGVLYCIVVLQVRVHSIVYTADNVLTPQVIRTIYKQRKLLDKIIAGQQNKTFKVRNI